jgi:hypothetical protein
MRRDSSTRSGGKLSRAWRAIGHRPASGTSFLVLITVASLLAIGLTIWRLASLTSTARARGASTDFRM